MSIRCSKGCWCCRSNCTHQNRCFKCSSGKVSDSDRLLFLSVRESFDEQGPLYSHLIITPLCPLIAVIGCLCCGDKLRRFDEAKLNQGHRFDECVCCNIITSFTMQHDDKFVYPVNGASGAASITIINPAFQQMPQQMPQPAQPNSSNQKIKDMVKVARVEKLIQEGRISEAEMLARS